MSEKPIIFSTLMVKAILEGKKTMTRRIFKKVMQKYVGYKNSVAEQQAETREQTKPLTEKEFYEVYSPIQKGDTLWVRETYCPHYYENLSPAYKADYDKTKIGDVVPEPKWKPSIHMKREAARIFLEVLSVRVERLQKITEKDAIKEGLPESMTGASGYTVGCFQNLWDSLNAERGYLWKENPWVWVIEFRRSEK